jgi:hypothetical protein
MMSLSDEWSSFSEPGKKSKTATTDGLSPSLIPKERLSGSF